MRFATPACFPVGWGEGGTGVGVWFTSPDEVRHPACFPVRKWGVARVLGFGLGARMRFATPRVFQWARGEY